MAFARFSGWLALAALLLLGVSPATADDTVLTPAEIALLAPPDLSSPRTTLLALSTSVKEAYDTLAKAYDEYQADPGFFATPKVSEEVGSADLLLKRAIATLDLSEVPAVNREQTGIETALLFGEILARLPPIDPETVPDAAAVKADGTVSWTLPNTDLEIVKAEKGPKAGRFVFSAASVARAVELYDTVRDYGGRAEQGRDLYRFYTLTPGDLLPPKWYFWIEKLPFWAQDSVFLGHAVWQWVGILLTLVILFGAWWAIVRFVRHHTAAPLLRARYLPKLIPPLLLIGVALLAKRILVTDINVSGQVLFAASTVLQGVVYLAGAWATYLVCAGLGERIASSPRIDRSSVDANLLRVAARVLGITAAIFILFIGATDIGLPVYGIIAGLGVGGLALGLAARPTLENLIGGFTLYADRPVRVGDFCKFGEKYGVVEEIGLRSTRIRAVDRTLITIPNAEFSNMVLINYTRRDQTLLNVVVRLRYETTAAEMNAVLEGIRRLLLEQPQVVHEGIRVRFEEFGSYSLGISIRAYVQTPHVSAFLEVQEEILFGIMKVIEAAGAQMAFLPQLAFSDPRLHPAESAAGSTGTAAE